MNFREFLKDNVVIFDGGLGTLLQKQGLKAGEHPETWNISHADIVQKIHTDYFNAGSNMGKESKIVTTNATQRCAMNLLRFSFSTQRSASKINAGKTVNIAKQAIEKQAYTQQAIMIAKRQNFPVSTKCLNPATVNGI